MVDEEIFRKLEEMDNKLERIKSDTHNLNRIASLQNSTQIIAELWKAVGKSEVRAAILHYTKEEIGATELTKILGINQNHLAMYMKPFVGNRSIIDELPKGRNKYFQRSELVDFVNFEEEPEFQELIKSWEAKRSKQMQADVSTTTKEQTSATQP